MHPLVPRLALIGVLAALALLAGLTLADRDGDDNEDAPHVGGAPPHEHAAPLAPDAAIAGASLHHLGDVWTDQRGRPLRLGDLRGHPTVVVMFYGSCLTACPVLLHDAARVDAALDEADRLRTRFLMVTFDPGRDTPERLAAYAAEKGLDRDRWSFLTAPPRAVRRLAAALGVRDRADGRGGFAHTNLVTVLDLEGVIRYRVEGLGGDVASVVAAIAAMR